MRRLFEGGAYSSKYGRRNFCVKNYASTRWFQAAEVDASSQTKQSMNSLFSKCSSDSVKEFEFAGKWTMSIFLLPI